MAQASTGAKAHRPSASRIIPAIPRSLGPKPPPRLDQPAVGPAKALQTPPESQDSGQADGGTGEVVPKTPDRPGSQFNGSLTPPVDASEGSIAITPLATQDTNILGASQKSGDEFPEELDQVEENVEARPITASSSTSKARQDDLKAGEGSDVPSNRESLPAPSPTRRPAGGALIFGGAQDSATSSPSHKEDAPTIPSRAQQQPPPHPGGPRPGAVPFVPQGHAYHFSEPFAGPSYPIPFPPNARQFHEAPGYFQAPPVSPYSSSFHQSQGRPHPPPRRYDSQGFQPRYPTPPYHSQSFGQPGPRHSPSIGPYSKPAGAVHPSIMPTQTPTPDIPHRYAEQVGAPRFNPTKQPLTPETPRFRPQQPDPEASFWLSDYLHGHFGVPDFADIHLRVSHVARLFAPTTIPAHGILLARSPKLRSLMAMHTRMPPDQMMPVRILNLIVNDRFLCYEGALSMAMMRLYADPLPDAATMTELAKTTAPQLDLEQSSMRFTLAYAAAGHFLQMSDVISHGLFTLATTFLSWKNIDCALAFSLDGGMSPMHHREGSQEDKDSSSSFDGSQSKLDSPTSTPTYGYYSDRMLQSTLDFIVENWPSGFDLLSATPQLEGTPRLPAVGDTVRAPSRSHRFTGLRFGDFTGEEEPTPEPAGLMLSSTLLSLPLPALKQILEHKTLGTKLGWPAVADLTRAVIAEREQRRSRAAAHKDNAEFSTALEERLWHNVRWAELVEESQNHPSGTRITRQRLGSDTPPTSVDSTRS